MKKIKTLSLTGLFVLILSLLPILLSADYFRIYEHKNFEGKSHYINLDNATEGQLNSLKYTNVHDDMSSVKWQLSPGRTLTFYEHTNGTGRTYVVTGTGTDSDTHNENFKDCASSWRMENTQSIPIAFSKTSNQGVTYRFQKNGFTMPSGGHLQGIQQLDKKHLVISGSSDDVAYFFIVKWNYSINPKELGKVIKVVRINDDFPGMTHNHSSGIQLAGKILVIGTEFIGGKNDGSNVVFYDLTNVYNPQKVGNKITREVKTSGAVGIVRRSSDYLLAVGNWDSADIDFYTSNTTNLASSNCIFTHLKEWKWKGSNHPTSGWIDGNWEKYQGINLMSEPDGKLYLMGFHRNSSGKDWADLYSLNVAASKDYMLKKVAKKHVYCKNGASFKYSGGIFAANPSSKINLWTTEKNFQTQTVLSKRPPPKVVALVNLPPKGVQSG